MVKEDFPRSEAKVLDGEQDLVRDVLIVMLALNARCWNSCSEAPLHIAK
jgi:hypothetical protein